MPNRKTPKDSASDVTAERDLQLDLFLSLMKAESREPIFQALVDCTREWLQVSQAALWWRDANHNGFRLQIAGQNGKKTGAEGNFFPYEAAGKLGLLSSDDPIELPSDDIFNTRDFDLAGGLAGRIHYDDRTMGVLIAFPNQREYSWTESELSTFRKVFRNGSALCRNLEKREKLPRTIELFQEMNEKTSFNDLYGLILREGKALLACDRAVVRGINFENGHLTYKDASPKADHSAFTLPPGEGVTGLALQSGTIYRIPDVTSPEWVNTYRPLWRDLPATRSELAVPILLKKYRVHVKTKYDFVEKPFGVLNFESPAIDAFSEVDEYCAKVIAQLTARVMEKIEYDDKLGKIRKASQKLATLRDWDSIVTTLLNAIRDSLGFEFASLSIVDPDVDVIRCERVLGLPIGDPEEFRKEAVHPLKSNHVQPHVVQYGWTDVPDPDDPRLSPINKKYGLDKLIRVFVPMTVRSRDDDTSGAESPGKTRSQKDEVIGTVSAGYDRKYRKHIYWRDLQLLRILVAFGTNAMELWHRNDIDRVSHEMNAPLTAVRANLERLRHKRDRLREDQIDLALEDMETDTNVLYYQMQRLAYVLGGKVSDAAKQPLNVELVALFGDIIFKTLSQLRPVIRNEGLDPRKVSYPEDVMYKVSRMYVDKSKISQVVFNLFMNAVKYSKSPETFQIRIDAEEKRDNYVIKFCDWGIGVPAGMVDRIFEDRFRAPSAQKVAGQGLGLTIARELMREHGGDLILKNRQQPTEFHLIFPKKLKEKS